MIIKKMHTDLFQHLVFVAFRHDGDEVKVQLGMEFQRKIACSISKRWVYWQVVFLLRLVGLSSARLVAERLQLVKEQVAVGEVFGCTAPVSVGESWLHQSTNPSLPRQPSALVAGPHQKQGWWLDSGRLGIGRRETQVLLAPERHSSIRKHPQARAQTL